MLRQIIENVITEGGNDLVKQLKMSTDLAYNTFIGDAFEELQDDFSKKDILKMIMNGKEKEVDYDFNAGLTNACKKVVQKLSNYKSKFTEGEWNSAFSDAEKQIKDPIKKEVFAEIENQFKNLD